MGNHRMFIPFDDPKAKGERIRPVFRDVGNRRAFSHDLDGLARGHSIPWVDVPLPPLSKDNLETVTM